MKLPTLLYCISLVSLSHAYKAIASEYKSFHDVMANINGCFDNSSSENACWQEQLIEAIPEKMYDFGVHYANGDGVKQDFSKGRYWIHQAALKGYPLAQYNLGVMFFDGMGGIQSQECATQWLNKAALDEGDSGLMAKQTLTAMADFNTQSAGATPKIYRQLTAQECEKLPDIHFPEVAIDEQQPLILDMQLLNDTSLAVNNSLNTLREKINQIEPKQLETIEEPAPLVIGLYREKIGHYFIQLGQHLLGQKETLPKEYAINRDETLQNIVTESEEDLQEQTVMVTCDRETDNSENGVIETFDTPLEADEPLFIARVLDHPVATQYDQLDIMEPPQEEPLILVPEKENNIQRLPSATEEIKTQTKPTELKTVKSPNLGSEIRYAQKKHYTLQLSSASQAEPLLALAKKQKLSNYLVYETQRHGRRWYVLVYGEYAGMTQAKQALQQLPVSLKKDTPWIRSLADVQAEL